MPPLREPAEFDRYKAVLEESGRFRGCIQWKQIAAEWVREHLDAHTQKSVEWLMYEHRGDVYQAKESRPEYRDRYSYHYDFLIPIDGRVIYIETVFEPGVSDDAARIRVVSIHPNDVTAP